MAGWLGGWVADGSRNSHSMPQFVTGSLCHYLKTISIDMSTACPKVCPTYNNLWPIPTTFNPIKPTECGVGMVEQQV